MGRSVNYLSGAIRKTFFDVSLFTVDGLVEALDDDDNEIRREPNDLDYQNNWDDFFVNIKYALRGKWGLNECKDKWDGDETSIIYENRYCEIGVSEYCGLASVSIRVNPTSEGSKYFESIAIAYIEAYWDEMLKEMDENVGHERLNKTGSFSNGESVYEKALK